MLLKSNELNSHGMQLIGEFLLCGEVPKFDKLANSDNCSSNAVIMLEFNL